MQIISGGVESDGCRYFQHRQEIPDHIRRPSVVGNRRRKDKERSRPALSADENTGDMVDGDLEIPDNLERAAREKNISIAHVHCGAIEVGAGIPFPFPFPPGFLK